MHDHTVSLHYKDPVGVTCSVNVCFCDKGHSSRKSLERLKWDICLQAVTGVFQQYIFNVAIVIGRVYMCSVTMIVLDR